MRCLQGLVCRVGLLTHILEEAVRQEEQGVSVPITAADLSCSLLTRLKSMLHDYSLQGGPRGQSSLSPLHFVNLLMIELWYYAPSGLSVPRCKLKNQGPYPIEGIAAHYIPLRMIMTVVCWIYDCYDVVPACSPRHVAGRLLLCRTSIHTCHYYSLPSADTHLGLGSIVAIALA